MSARLCMALLISSITPALAQQPLDADCRPVPFRGYVMTPQPQDPDCLRQRAETARQVEVARRKQEAEVAAAKVAQVGAEESPDNICREPANARRLIDSYNSFDWDIFPPRKVVDIEHLVTISGDEKQGMLSCHGIWVHTNGWRVEGTMTYRPNVAGDIIASWHAESWAPPVTAGLTPLAPAAPSSSSNALPSSSGSFQDGLAARQVWENWVQQIGGDQKAGALYWASQRSLAHPGSCATLAGDAIHGCEEAKARLTSSDVMRKTDPDYRRGWNSLVVTTQ